MTEQDISRYQDIIVTTATDVGLKVLVAIAFWVIGRWLIGVAVGMVRAALEKQKVDPTVLRYVGSIVTVTLNVLLVIGILGYFGIQTTTFAALIAGAGIANDQHGGLARRHQFGGGQETVPDALRQQGFHVAGAGRRCDGMTLRGQPFSDGAQVGRIGPVHRHHQ